ncbi:MAG: hypothetical protein IKN49_00655 [Elusimicrobiaceae bacterium]|nr:hypothetical protein [Elusimicrobiaceae bacterium]
MKKLMVLIGVLGLFSGTAHAIISSPVLTSYSGLFKKGSQKEEKALSQAVDVGSLKNQEEKEFQEASEALKDLFEKDVTNATVTLEEVEEWHQQLRDIFNNTKGTEPKFYYQDNVNRLEIFASFMQGIEDATLRRNIEAILNHQYYFPNYKTEGLVSLKKAALELSELSVKQYSLPNYQAKTAGFDRETESYFNTLIPANPVAPQALREALRAENALRKQAASHAEHSGILNGVLAKHQYLVGVLASDTQKSFAYQDAEIALEKLAQTALSIKDEALLAEVKDLLNHQYYFVYNYGKLASLDQIAENVDHECLTLGNGISTARLKPFARAFYNVK